MILLAYITNLEITEAMLLVDKMQFNNYVLTFAFTKKLLLKTTLIRLIN